MRNKFGLKILLLIKAVSIEGVPIFILFLLLTTSCSTPRLFQPVEVSEESLNQFILNAPTESNLRPGDKITISIWGHEDLSIGSINSPFTTDEGTGRWVVLDEEGEVNLPRVGRVKLSGYNIKEAGYFLEQKYTEHIKDPVVNVRVLNHFVTVLGEVNNPGKIRINSEKVNLVNLLGQAGGMTKYAEFEKIQLLRNHNGQPVSIEIDFSTFDVLKDKNAVLQPDDIVYVPPRSKKQTEEVINKVVPIVSILTGIAVIFSVFNN